MSETAGESLEKEFELERMILFSDAVFAIAITLLILEIKFPEIPKNNTKSLLELFKPTVIHFLAFVISFFFIGMSWSRHLQLCKYLKQYNRRVIFFNLLLLFFIVTFPFSISGFTENANGELIIPLIIYLFNILMVTFAQFLLTNYVLKRNAALVVKGYELEKKYFYLQALYGFIVITVTFISIVAVATITKGNLLAIRSTLYVLPVLALIMRRILKKHKPPKKD